MKRLFLFVVFGFITISCLSQVSKITFTDDTNPDDINEFISYDKGNQKVFKQFVIPIESNGVSINNGISLTIKGLSNVNSYSIRLVDLKTPGVKFIDTSLIVNAGSATYDLTFNGASASTVYRIIIWNVTTGKEFTFSANFGGGIVKPYEYYIVTERSKTGTFANSPTNYKYKINWVDYWLNNHNAPLFTNTPAQFIAGAEQALKFNWQKQITEWNLCNGVINNQPLDDNNEFDLNIDGYNPAGADMLSGLDATK
jgi:hypothetical protein